MQESLFDGFNFLSVHFALMQNPSTLLRINQAKKSNQSEEIPCGSFASEITRLKLRFAISLNCVCNFYLKYILNFVNTYYFCRLMISTWLEMVILTFAVLGASLILFNVSSRYLRYLYAIGYPLEGIIGV
tara:strand:- start:34 stop:423 length:390 start_codon:yes stop_codon:yes gene_type:complete